MEIGQKIKFLRQQNNLTQEELGDRCELSKGFISMLEKDKTSPSIATLKDILEALREEIGLKVVRPTGNVLVVILKIWIVRDGLILRSPSVMLGEHPGESGLAAADISRYTYVHIP